MRETNMRQAFVKSVQSVIASHRPVQQPKLVKRIARLIDQGSGLRGKR